jgi:transcriptional regulator with XRE-family HTH domain
MYKKKTSAAPNWLDILRSLMDAQGLNPRSLSLKAGLNATAVRDMLEGRSRFPRYDTARQLAEALATTPAMLMGDEPSIASPEKKVPHFSHDSELLTEILTRLQEASSLLNRQLPPRDFADMAVTIFQGLQDGDSMKSKSNAISRQIRDLLDCKNRRRA